MTLHHLALGARDVERLATFYAEAFELRELTRHHDGAALRSVWLELGPGSCLMIERTAEELRPVALGVGAGPFLLAFRVAEEERETAERRLERCGASIEARSAHTSYARDPEGNRVAVSCYPLEVEK